MIGRLVELQAKPGSIVGAKAELPGLVTGLKACLKHFDQLLLHSSVPRLEKVCEALLSGNVSLVTQLKKDLDNFTGIVQAVTANEKNVQYLSSSPILHASIQSQFLIQLFSFFVGFRTCGGSRCADFEGRRGRIEGESQEN